MTRLCGAYSLSGAAIEAAFDAGLRRAMLRALGAGGRELVAGPLWACAAPELLVSEGRRALALEGLVTAPPDAAALEGIARTGPEWFRDLGGHWVAAFADAGAGRLTLVRHTSGGERLFFARRGDVLLFSASIRALLAVIPRKPDAAALREYLINGAVLSETRTLWDGVEELPPNGAVTFEAADRRWAACERFEPPRPLEEALARERLRRALFETTAETIGPRRRVAVALSGGIDSSAIAAAAAEVVGPENVEAFTYEFPDSGLTSEAGYAAAVCRHLGIRKHHLVPVRYRDHLSALAETAWRCEEVGSTRGNPVTMLLAKAAAREGFDLLLTGAAMEKLIRSGLSRHDRLRALAELLERRPAARRRLAWWPRTRGLGARWSRIVERLLPGAAAVPEPVYFVTLAALKSRGVVDDLAAFFPPPMGALARGAYESAWIQARVERLGGASLSDVVEYLCFVAYDQSRLFARKGKLTREAGAVFAAPAYLPACARNAPYFSWHAQRRGARPVKFLLKDAFRDRLPAAVVDRPKIEDSMIVPPAWFRASMEHLRPALLRREDAVAEAAGCRPDDLRRHAGSNLRRLALWHRLFVERPPSPEAPSLSEIEGA